MDDSDFFGERQQIALSITPIITGVLSTAGSTIIIIIILRDRKRKLKQTYHRLLLGISISDWMNSVRASTSSFLVPKGTPGMWQTHGTTATCVAQGFFAQLGLATTVYWASLCLYFLMQIQSQQDREARIERVEVFFHLIPIGFALSTAIAGVFLDLYNPVKLGIGCWVAPYPIGCDDDGSEIPCERGENAGYLIWLFAGIIVSVVLLIVIVCMVTIYCRVRRQMNAMQQRYSVAQQESASARLKLTFQQANLYIFSSLLTYLFPCILRVMENDGSDSRFFFLSFMSQVLYPLQGAFNFIIYARPRYRDLKKHNPNQGILALFCKLFEVPANSDSSLRTAATVQSQQRTAIGRRLRGLFTISEVEANESEHKPASYTSDPSELR